MAKERLKIAFLSFFNGIYERGVEVLVEELAKRLVSEHEMVIFQGGKAKSSQNYKIKYIPTDWKPYILEQPLNLKRRLYQDQMSLAVREFTKKAIPILKKKKFDIIIPWNNGWQTFLARLSGVGKIVVVGQSGIGWDDRINLLLFPNAFVGFTDYQCQWAKKVNPFVKVVKIPNGVDPREFNPTGSKLDLDLSDPIILVASALVPMKRLDLIIRAVSKLSKGSLVLCGRGELKIDLLKLGNELLPGRFKIMELDHINMEKLFRSVDLFTFSTSPWESFGLVLLEAMASGLAVVATDDPIRREIVGDAGLFVDVSDPQKYADAIKEALEKDWGDKPRKQAEKFSWDKVAAKYEELFKELVLRRNDEG